MTTKLEQAARQALGALVRAEAMYGQPNADIQTALREALAVSEQRMEEQAEQEPVDGVLPCPFCGDNQPTVFEGSTFRWRVAVCNNCGAYAPEARHDTLAEDQKQAGIESDAAAITAWNTRAAPVEPVEHKPVAIGNEWKPCMKLPIVVHVREQREGETHASTREGITPILPTDLIMRGVAGEEYPIGYELFNKTYTFEIAAPVQPVKQEPFMCEPVPPISEDGWTDWVCPKPQGYLMQCCDCGLIHEVDSRVAMYQPMPSEEFEVVENPNMQCQWRVRRRDDLRESNVKV